MGVCAIARLPISALNDPGSFNWNNQTSFAAGPNDDSCPKRFYFGQIPFLLVPGAVTHVNFGNSEPQQARFHFLSPDPSEAVVIKFFKRAANSLQVFASGVQVRSFNDALEASPPPAGTPTTYPGFADAHGASLFNPQARHVTFVMRGQSGWGVSTIDIFTLASVQLSLTMSISNAAFFEPARVVGNLAQLLSIDPSRIKVVSVAAAPAVRQLAGALRLPRAAADASQQVLLLEILPPPNSTVLSQASAFSATDPGALTAPDPGSATAVNSAAAASLVAASMASVASAITSLYTGGSLGTLGGYPVAALSVTPPTVPVVPGLATPSPVPSLSPTASGGGAAAPGRLEDGAIAGIVVAAIVAVAAGTAAALLWHRHYRGSTIKALTQTPGGRGSGSSGGGGASVIRQPHSTPGAHKGLALNLPQLGSQHAPEASPPPTAPASSSSSSSSSSSAEAEAGVSSDEEGAVATGGRAARRAALAQPLPNSDDELAAPNAADSSRTLPGATSAAKPSRAHMASTRLGFKPEQPHTAH
jgi:hypothetical protein